MSAWDRRPVLFSSAAFFARPLAETFRIVAEAGYRGVEVMVTKDPASQDAKEIRRLAREHGLTVGAIHAPSLLLTRKVWGTDPVGKIYRAMEVAQDAEIPTVVMHPPYRWQRGYRRWLEERLPGLEGGTGVTVAMENMFPRAHRRARRDLPRQPGPRGPRGTPRPRARHVARGRGAPRPGGGAPPLRRARCATCICRTTRARGGTRTSRPARGSSTWTVPHRSGGRRLPRIGHPGGGPAALPHRRREAARGDGRDARVRGVAASPSARP